MEIIESAFMDIIRDLAKNNKNLTPALQDAIAKYLNYQSTPTYSYNVNAMFGDHNAKAVLSEDLE